MLCVKPQISSDVIAEIRESNTWVAETAVTEGDRLKIASEGGTVRYYLNDTLVHTSATPPVYPQVADAVLLAMDSEVNDAVILGAGESGFGVLIFALGLGVAFGVIVVSVLQKRIPKEWVFVAAVFVAGGSLFTAASMSDMEPAAAFVFVLGICAGTVYVLGFTMLHQHVEDEFRGRIFSALYTLVRMCVLASFTLGPFLSELFSSGSRALFDDGHASLFGLSIGLPGVRLTLWTAAVIIIAAGFIAAHSIRDAHRKEMVEAPPTKNGKNGNGTSDGG
jgi:MFS family permease